MHIPTRCLPNLTDSSAGAGTVESESFETSSTSSITRPDAHAPSGELPGMHAAMCIPPLTHSPQISWRRLPLHTCVCTLSSVVCHRKSSMLCARTASQDRSSSTVRNIACMTNTHIDRQRQTETDRDRQRQTQTETDTHTYTHTNTYSHSLSVQD